MAPDNLGAATAFIYILTRDYYPEGVLILKGFYFLSCC